MKKQIEKIIDQLADKSLTFGCRVMIFADSDVVVQCVGNDKNGLHFSAGGLSWTREHDEIDDIKILGHPVRIGDVIEIAAVAWTEEQQKQQWLELVGLWYECEAAKSLQEIFGPECEWNTYWGGKDDEPKDPAKKALAEFLLTIFNA